MIEFNIRFCNFRDQETKIFSSPFDIDVEQTQLSLQIIVIELQENFELTTKIRDISVAVS